MEQETQVPQRILVVDDDKQLLSAIQEYLELCNYHVTTAATGLDALRLLRSETYHVLVTDIVMPDVSGLGIVEISQKEFPELHIIAISGYGNQIRDLTLEKSPHQYLEKPFKLTELLKAIESGLSKE